MHARYFLILLLILTTTVSYAYEGDSNIVVLGGNPQEPIRNVILYSKNGTNWQKGKLPPGLPYLTDVIARPGFFTIYSKCNERLASYTGKKWYIYQISLCTDRMVFDNGIYNNLNNGRYVGAGPTFDVSVDGLSFSSKIGFGPGLKLSGVVYGDGKGILVGTNEQDHQPYIGIIFGDDRVNVDFPGGYLNDIAFKEGTFVAVGFAILVSKDGFHWQKFDNNGKDGLNSITVGKGLFVAVGNCGKVIYSKDGQSWLNAISNTKNDLSRIIWSQSNKQFIAVGKAGTIIMSEDGKKWKVLDSKTSHDLISVASL